MTAAAPRRYPLIGALMLTTALAVSACGGSDPATAPSTTAAASGTAQASATLAPAEQSAVAAYVEGYFDDVDLTSGLHGDNFTGGPLTEVMELCDTTVALASQPIAATHAISMTGGGLNEQDKGTVTRSVAVYPTAAEATTVHDAITAGLAQCQDADPQAITPLRLPGTPAWLRVGYSNDPGLGAISAGVQQVWTATQVGRSVLVQYESLPTEVPLAQARIIAATLIETSKRLQHQLETKVP